MEGVAVNDAREALVFDPEYDSASDGTATESCPVERRRRERIVGVVWPESG